MYIHPWNIGVHWISMDNWNESRSLIRSTAVSSAWDWHSSPINELNNIKGCNITTYIESDTRDNRIQQPRYVMAMECTSTQMPTSLMRGSGSMVWSMAGGSWRCVMAVTTLGSLTMGRWLVRGSSIQPMGQCMWDNSTWVRSMAEVSWYPSNVIMMGSGTWIGGMVRGCLLLLSIALMVYSISINHMVSADMNLQSTNSMGSMYMAGSVDREYI